MNTFDKVIFVCNGNTCRSPMAATVMANLKQDIISESRGMVVLFPEPYNPKAVAVAAKHNMIIPNNSAKQLLNEDFGNDTLVLAMDSSMKQKIYDEYSEAINVYTLSEYAGEPEQEIKDPMARELRNIMSVSSLYTGLLVMLQSIWISYQKKKKIKEKNNDSNWL